MRTVLAAVAATCLVASPVCAQTTTAVTLQPEHRARWDAAFHLGWLGVNKAEIAPEWNNWYDAASAGGSAGYYLTPHVRVGIDVARGTQNHVYSYPTSYIAGPRRDEFRTMTFTGTVAYQLLDNAWFHPFVGVGIDVVRESARVNLPEYVFRPSPTAPPVIVPAQISDWQLSVNARPMATAGFKWYASERAFVRSELRAAFSSKRTESLEWRTGFGFDF